MGFKNLSISKIRKRNETGFFNVSQQNPTLKQTEASNLNEHFLLKQLLEAIFFIIVCATHS